MHSEHFRTSQCFVFESVVCTSICLTSCLKSDARPHIIAYDQVWVCVKACERVETWTCICQRYSCSPGYQGVNPCPISKLIVLGLGYVRQLEQRVNLQSFLVHSALLQGCKVHSSSKMFPHTAPRSRTTKDVFKEALRQVWRKLHG